MIGYQRRVIGNCVTLLVVAGSLAGCITKPVTTEPCDLLVEMNPSPETSTFIVKNDRPFAQSVASHRGRYQRYKCG